MRKIFFLSYLMVYSCYAVEETPWLTPFFVFQPKAAFTVETFQESGEAAKWGKFSLSNTFPDSYGIEIWAVEAWTPEQKGSIDHFGVEGAYQIWDQLQGDPCTLTARLVLQQAFLWSLRDPASFHHGKREKELLLSFGRESFIEQEWTTRWFGATKVGIAERGSPWLQGICGIAGQWQDKHQVSLKMHYLAGLGSRRLSFHHFNGYGEIAHRSMELSVGYTYSWAFSGQLHLGYANRLYAKNFPHHWQQYLLQFIYPFGL